MPEQHPSSVPNEARAEPELDTPPVLILAPLDADARALSRVVEAYGFPRLVCEDAQALGDGLRETEADGVPFAVVSQEGASSEAGEFLDTSMSEEPSWARLPTVFLVRSASRPPPACRILDRKVGAPPFIVLERPVRRATLQNVFEARAEARQRQFETRDLLSHLKQEEERRRFLLSELRHRTRNSLAVLQSLSSMSTRRTKDLESFANSFAARLRALTDAHVSLTNEGSALRDMNGLLTEHVIFYTFEADQLDLGGPAITVSEKLAFDLALVTHELATNAAKYGALSVETGRVEGRWSEDADTGDLLLRWEECNGPSVRAPDHQGLGTRVISSFLAGEAEASIEFLEDGLSWTARIHPYEFEYGGPISAQTGPGAGSGAAAGNA